MIALAVALGVVGLVWVIAAHDVARRWIARGDDDTRARVAAHERELGELRTWRTRLDEERRQEGAARALGRGR